MFLLFYSCIMIITSQPSFGLTAPPFSNLRSTLRDKANKIRQQSFKISANSNYENLNQKQQQSKGFMQMLNKLTHVFKQQFKYEKKKYVTQSSVDDKLNFQNCATVKQLKYENNLVCPKFYNKKRTVFSESNFQVNASYYNFKGPFQRKMSYSNNRQKILKGRSISRTRTQNKKLIFSVKSQPPAKQETEMFVPIGNIHLPSSIEQAQQDKPSFKNEKISQRSSCEDQPLKQIYDRIFIQYPSKKSQRRKPSQNERKFKSSTQLHDKSRQAIALSTQKLKTNQQPIFISIQTNKERKNRSNSLLSPWANQQC